MHDLASQDENHKYMKMDLERQLEVKERELKHLTDKYDSDKQHYEALRSKLEALRQSDINELVEIRQELVLAQVKAAKLEGQVHVMEQMNQLNKDNASSSMSILFDKVKGSAGKSRKEK